jgi:hypothetical protein
MQPLKFFHQKSSNMVQCCHLQSLWSKALWKQGHAWCAPACSIVGGVLVSMAHTMQTLAECNCDHQLTEQLSKSGAVAVSPTPGLPWLDRYQPRLNQCSSLLTATSLPLLTRSRNWICWRGLQQIRRQILGGLIRKGAKITEGKRKCKTFLKIAKAVSYCCYKDV